MLSHDDLLRAKSVRKKSRGILCQGLENLMIFAISL